MTPLGFQQSLTANAVLRLHVWPCSSWGGKPVKRQRLLMKNFNRQVAIAATAMLVVPNVHAIEIDTGNSDVKIRWDNTVNLTTSYRVKKQAAALTGAAVSTNAAANNTVDYGANQDDGDRNFDKGFISKRADVLSELEIGTWDYGARVSAAAWYDQVYNQNTDHDLTNSNNHTQAGFPGNKFANGTKSQHGRGGELLDAFAWSKFDVGEMPATVRLGRHSLVYGETVFFGSNGIAEAQGPIDLVKIMSSPSTEFKDVLRPVEQVSANIQLTDSVSLGGYYQFKWHETKIPAAGSYFSTADFVGAGSEYFIAVPGTSGTRHGVDAEPRDKGQFGLQVQIAPDTSDWQYGIYGARYHAKTPTVMYNEAWIAAGPTFAPTSYRWVYAQDIKTFGASATTSVGQLNVATEASVRYNAPLTSDTQSNAGGVGAPSGTGTGNNTNNPLYAVGNTAHLNVNGIYVMEPSDLWDGGSFVGELAMNRTMKVKKNRTALDPNTTSNAASLRMVFTPAYFQVLPGLDLEVPMGLGWNFLGRSSAIGNFGGGSSKAGDFSLGLKGTYQSDWEFSMNYVGYFGKAGQYLEPISGQANPNAQLSFNQPLKDRDFITLNVKRAF